MNRDWGELPMELLSNILGRLKSLSDYFRFSVVCASWYSVAKENRSQRAKMVSTRYRPPMLLISNDRQEGTWNVYNVMVDKVLGLQLKVPKKSFYGCSNGWLITVEDSAGVISLTNPFLRVEGNKEEENSIIRLPLLDHMRHEEQDVPGHCILRAAILGDPLLSANNCIVVVILRNPHQLAFITLGKDTTWTCIDKYIVPDSALKRRLHCADVVCFQGKYYAVDYSNCLYSFNIVNQSKAECQLRCPPQSLGEHLFFDLTIRYLVDSNGEELWMIVRYVGYCTCATISFEVWKMDFDEFRWREKEIIGDDVAIFVGDHNGSAILVMDLSSSVPGYQSNCIYFTYLDDRERARYGDGRPEAFGVYNLETKSFSQPRTTLAESLMKMTKLSPTPMWIVPPFQ